MFANFWPQLQDCQIALKYKVNNLKWNKLQNNLSTIFPLSKKMVAHTAQDEPLLPYLRLPLPP